MIGFTNTRRRTSPASSEARGPTRPPHGRANRPNDEGFALVDMLVALTLASVLAALMMTFLGQARTLGRLAADARIQTELDAVVSYLDNMMATAEPMPLAGEISQPRPLLQGGPALVSFNTVQRIGFDKAGLQQVTIALSEGGPSQRRLELTARPRLGFAAEEAQAERVVLLSDVRSFRLEYMISERRLPVWTETWGETANLPSAIRFSLSIERAGKAYRATGLAMLGVARGIAAADAR